METSQISLLEPEQTSSPLASHASRTLAPGSEWATRMTELSGLSLARSLRESSPIGSLLRTLLASSAWRSTACYLTWKRKATKQGRSYFQLAPSTPRTDGIGSGLWATPRASEAEHPGRRSTLHGGQIGLAEQVNNSVLWPTPRAQENGQNLHWQKKGYALSAAVKLFPTPRATEWKNPKGKTGNRTPEDANRAGWTLSEVAMLPTPTANRWDGLQSHGVNVVEGSLNPQFVEYLMNFPTDWTKLD